MVDASVQAFVDEHSDAELLESGKVRCTSTGHEVAAPTRALCDAYWGGTTYRKRRAQAEYDFAQHEPWIVPNKKNKHMLFCMLTKQPLSRQPATVKGHVNSKRYKRLRKEHEEQGLAPGEKPKRLTKEEKRAAKRTAQADGATSGGADDEGEGEEIFDDEDGGEGVVDEEGDDEGDAAEWRREGAFWEGEEGEEGDAGEEEEEEEEPAARPTKKPKSEAGAAAHQKEKKQPKKKEEKKKKSRPEAAEARAKDDDVFWVGGSSEPLRSGGSAATAQQPPITTARTHTPSLVPPWRASGAAAAGGRRAAPPLAPADEVGKKAPAAQGAGQKVHHKKRGGK